MQRSHFCWVPPGQRYGDARRHIISAFHGCIPVFTIPDGHHTLEEVVPWGRMSVSVAQEELPLLPAILRNISAERRDEMRHELSCAWRRLWYSSIYGQCLGEEPQTDAFDGLLQVFAQRLQGGGGQPPPVQSAHQQRLPSWRRRWPSRAACGVGGAETSSVEEGARLPRGYPHSRRNGSPWSTPPSAGSPAQVYRRG